MRRKRYRRRDPAQLELPAILESRRKAHGDARD